jgi:hypothetical protein
MEERDSRKIKKVSRICLDKSACFGAQAAKQKLLIVDTVYIVVRFGSPKFLT